MVKTFLSRSKSLANADDAGEPSSSRSQSRPSTSSSVFPSLLKLDTSGPSKSSSSRPSSILPSAIAPRSNRPTPLLSLKLTGSSFLDVVIRDRETKEPVYIIETVRDTTSIYRLNAETEEAVKVSMVQWPTTITKSKAKSGRSVLMANDRWREAEELLKLGPLGSIGTRKFNIPHYPHSLKWKLIPGGHFYCSTAGANGPFAILDSSVLSAPARLSIFHNCLEDDEDSRAQESFKGIPVLLLDYLITTSLLLVTEVQEWMDRQQTPSGTVRIPGSSLPAVKKWLAIIHDQPLPSSQGTSPAETSASTNPPWGSSSDRRVSSGSSSPPVSGTGTSPPTPSTPGTSLDSAFARPQSSEVPPVPPLPRQQPSTQPQLPSDPSLIITPFLQPHASSSAPHLPYPSVPLRPSTSTPPSASSGSTRLPRALPKPPMLPLTSDVAGERTSPWQSNQDAYRSNELLASSPLPQPDSGRSPSPSQSSSSGSGVSNPTHSRNRSSRGSMGRLVSPPLVPPPTGNLPLPPKLAQEYSLSPGRQRSSQTYQASPLGQSSSGGGGLQAMNPDPLDPEEEARIRGITSQMLSMHVSPRPAPSHPMGSPPTMLINNEGTSTFPGVHMDGGGVVMRDAAARHSYAETVYEMPPPAYDAIDFSLPRVRLPPNQGP